MVCEKEGQVIANTWHGTPLKKMGKDVGNRAYDMGNVQKSQLMADYLIYPSDYMRDTMASAYFLTDLYKGKILCCGYPRNSIFSAGGGPAAQRAAGPSRETAVRLHAHMAGRAEED